MLKHAKKQQALQHSRTRDAPPLPLYSMAALSKHTPRPPPLIYLSTPHMLCLSLDLDVNNLNLLVCLLNSPTLTIFWTVQKKYTTLQDLIWYICLLLSFFISSFFPFTFRVLASPLLSAVFFFFLVFVFHPVLCWCFLQLFLLLQPGSCQLASSVRPSVRPSVSVGQSVALSVEGRSRSMSLCLGWLLLLCFSLLFLLLLSLGSP